MMHPVEDHLWLIKEQMISEKQLQAQSTEIDPMTSVRNISSATHIPIGSVDKSIIK